MGKPLDQATPEDLLRLWRRTLSHKKSGTHYAYLLKMFYRAAHETTDDAKYIKLSKVLKPRRINPTYGPEKRLDLAELQGILDAARTVRNRALIGMLWDTGARIHEVLALDFGEVKPATLPNNGNRRIFTVWFKKTKVEGEKHFGYVMDTAALLAAWLKTHPDPHLKAPLFTSWNGQRLSASRARAMTESVGARAMVKGENGQLKPLNRHIHPHIFRHARASYLRAAGVPDAQLKKLMGWSPNSTMLSRYAHLTDTEAFDSLLKVYGYVPEKVDLAKLTITEEDLTPAIPMMSAPQMSEEQVIASIDGLFKDEKAKAGAAVLLRALFSAAKHEKAFAQGFVDAEPQKTKDSKKETQLLG